MNIRVDIHVVTEGQSETAFVNKVLNPWFNPLNIYLFPYTVITKRDHKKGFQHKGGISTYGKLRNDIIKCLSYTKKENVYVTTMFDYYNFPSDIYGYDELMHITEPYEKVKCLENIIKKDIEKDKANSGKVFFPYLQIHEFETLIFCGLDILKKKHFDYDIKTLYDALDKFGNPELINDNKETAPSKRILQCIPNFYKVTVGVDIVKEIGVENLRQKCCHFANWISYIEKLNK